MGETPLEWVLTRQWRSVWVVQDFREVDQLAFETGVELVAHALALWLVFVHLLVLSTLVEEGLYYLS